jgi:hypothetical protein
MKSKCQYLEELFIEWENSIPNHLNHFVRDGIINEEIYESVSPKILFITKEVNNPYQLPGNFSEWWNEEIKYAFTLRIIEWAYGIIHGFPQYDTIWKRRGPDSAKQTIKKIAFMNVKKIGGKGSSHWKDILPHIKSNYEFLHKEIEIIEPEIIILGLSWQVLRDELFKGVNWIKSGYDIEIGKFKNSKLIDFYHPSSRNAPAAAYSLLQNVFQADQFHNL